MSSYLNYTDPSGNRVEVYENLKGWIRNPDAQAQKPLEDYEKERLGIEDAIESGLLGNKAGQIFLDYEDVIMGPPVTLPSSLVGIREAWSISGTSHHRRNWKRQREPQRVHGTGNMILHSAGKPERQHWITFWWR